MKYKKGNEKKRLVNTEIVRIKDNKRRELYIIFIFIVTLASLVLFYVWQRIENVELAYKLESLKGELQKIDDENTKLKIQFEKLSTLSRIEKIAREDLGMVIPPHTSIFITNPVKLKIQESSKTEMVLNRKK